MRAFNLFIFVAIIGVVTLIFSTSLFPTPSPLAVQYAPYGPSYEVPAGQNTIVAKLEVNEPLGSEVESLSEGQLSALRRGVVHGRDIRTDYVQSLRFFEPGVIDGGRLIFGKDEYNQVSDFLRFED